MTILFFARDPGAADVVSRLYSVYDDEKLCLAKDFARDFFSKQEIPFIDFNKEFADRDISEGDSPLISKILDSLSDVECVLTGTSHYDDFSDRLLWELCAERTIPSIAVLDQWLRYKERFVFGPKTYRPDLILCPSDEITEKLNALSIPRKTALSMGHPFLQSVLEQVETKLQHRDLVREKLKEKFKSDFSTLVLYASEPQNMLNKKGVQYEDVKYDEIEVFEFIKAGLGASDLESPLLLVKLHPKEEGNQYKNIHPYSLKDEIDKDLLLTASDIVIGTKSMMQIEAAVYGKYVLSVDLWNLPDEQLITNILGISHKVSDQSSLVQRLDDFKDVVPASRQELASLLGLNRDWKETFREALGLIGLDHA